LRCANAVRSTADRSAARRRRVPTSVWVVSRSVRRSTTEAIRAGRKSTDLAWFDSGRLHSRGRVVPSSWVSLLARSLDRQGRPRLLRCLTWRTSPRSDCSFSCRSLISARSFATQPGASRSQRGRPVALVRRRARGSSCEASASCDGRDHEIPVGGRAGPSTFVPFARCGSPRISVPRSHSAFALVAVRGQL
jgi:hypothetical protein